MGEDISSEIAAEGTTLLELVGVGVPPYSARGITETLQPIDIASQTRRTINGSLKDLSVSQFHKYKLNLTATDQQPPAVSGVWPGKLVAVKLISELCYETLGGVAEREAVAGSSRVEGDFTFYRPILNMRVIGFSAAKDEYGATVPWSMDLEEQ